MSEHVWCQENIAAYVAGGLDLSEGERLEAHLAGCVDCAGAVAAALALERRLAPLFQAANPGPALEDRLIRALPPKADGAGRLLVGWSARAKAYLALAAAVLLAVLGAGVGEILEVDGKDRTSAVAASLHSYGFEPRGVFGWIGGTSHHGQNFESAPREGTLKSADELAKEVRENTVGNSTAPLSLALADEIANSPLYSVHGKATPVLKPYVKSKSVTASDEGRDTRDAFPRSAKPALPERLEKDKEPEALGIGGVVQPRSGLKETDGKETNSPPSPSAPEPIAPAKKKIADASNDQKHPPTEYDDKGFPKVPLAKGQIGGMMGGMGGMMGGMPGMMGGMPGMMGGMPGGGNNDGLFGSPGIDGVDAGAERSKSIPRAVVDSSFAKPAETKKRELVWNQNKGSFPELRITESNLARLDLFKQKPADDKTRAKGDKDKAGYFEAQPGLPAPSSSTASIPSPTMPPLPPPPLAIPVPATAEPAPTTDSTAIVKESGKSDPAAPKPGQDKKDTPPPAKPDQPQPQQVRKIIIRTGELEFEIDSFDTSVAAIMKLINATKGGFIATINSEKLPNGKVRGSVVVRIPPEQLDAFVLDLRKELGKMGELKNQRIGSQDVTKQYTDLESRLRAARTMEDRLLNIIKDGKGQIKDLLLAEKELGVWRTQIEEIEGELRYFGNLASLSTLTIKLYEKDIRSAATITESERVQAGLEVEDVEKAHQEALKIVLDAKGRVSRSELKQHGAGQFNAILNFEVSPEATGPMRDRLRQLGTMVRLQIDRLQQTANGEPPAKNGKIERGDAQFQLSIFNLANIAPRETIILRIAAIDVPATYQKLREVVVKAKGHTINATLNEQDKQNINAQLDFDVRRVSEGEILAALAATGETLSRQTARVPEADNVTDSKVLFRIALVDADFIQPRETLTMRIAADSVPAAYQKLREALAKAKARVITAQLNEQDKRNITAQLDFSFARAEEGVLLSALGLAGETLSKQVSRLAENNNVTDAKVLARIELIHADTIQPRETITMKIAVVDVRAAYLKVREALAKVKSRVINAEVNEQEQDKITAQLDFTVGRGDENLMQTALSGVGDTLSRQVGRVPENANLTDTKVLIRVEMFQTDSLLPRDMLAVKIAAVDVPAAFETLKAVIGKVKGRVLNAQLDEQDRRNIKAQLDFTFSRPSENVVQTAIAGAGETLTRQANRLPATDDVTDTKVLVRIALIQADSLPARETVILRIAAVDVPAAYEALRTAVGKARGKIGEDQLNEQDRRNITARLTFDVPRTDEGALQTLLANIGEVLTRQSGRKQEGIDVTDTKIGFQIDLSPAAAIAPRETTTLALEVPDVAAALADFNVLVKDAQGQAVETQKGQERNGQVSAGVVYDVPLAAAAGLVEKFKAGREVRVHKVLPNPQAPTGKLALGRIVVTLSNYSQLVPNDQGIMFELRRGLSLSLLGLSKSLGWLIVGVLFVLPWALIIYAGVWLVRRMVGGNVVAVKPAVDVPHGTAG